MSDCDVAHPNAFALPMPSDPSSAPLRFGRCEIHPAQRALRIDGQPAALGARAFDLLLALAQRRDRLVTKQELLDLVWPGVVVEEHNIATQVGTLRKVLGAHAIATVPGRGYRFTAPLDDDKPAPPARASVEAETRSFTPPRLAPLLGRDADMAAIAALLESDRLITVVGAGGIGKSLLLRHLLAQQAARWADGVCWIEMAGISDAALLPARIAQSLGVRLGGPDPVKALAMSMAGLTLLLALDNAEHLRAGVAGLAGALLDGAPGLKLLVTSQTPLRLAGERVYRIGPLAVPQAALPAAQALGFASVALFVERARAADAHFVFGDPQAADAIEVCRRLDGLPLAIELAAARAPLLGLPRLASMMQDRLRLLTRNRDARAPARQQTLRAALEWTHALLDEAERKVFRRLAVIEDSASLSFIQGIVADDGGELDTWAVLDALSTLVDRSLAVVVSPDAAEPRYRVLETPRAYAFEQLDTADERALMQRRHAHALARRFQAAYQERWSGRQRIDAWQREILADESNARAALAWAIAAKQPEVAVILAVTLHAALPTWSRLDFTDFDRDALYDALVARGAPAGLQLEALWFAVRPLYHPSQARLEALIEAMLSLARQVDRDAADRWPLYRSLRLWILSKAYMAATPVDVMRAALAELDAIEDPTWPPHRLALGLEARSIALSAIDGLSTPEEELRIARATLATLEAAGADDRTAATASLVNTELRSGTAVAAVDIGERGLAALTGSRDQFGRFAISVNLVLALLALDRTARARELLQTVWPIAIRVRMTFACVDLPGLLAALEARPRAAAALAGYAEALHDAFNMKRQANERHARDRTVALARAALGDADYDALFEQGRKLPESEVAAVAFATGDASMHPPGGRG